MCLWYKIGHFPPSLGQLRCMIMKLACLISPLFTCCYLTNSQQSKFLFAIFFFFFGCSKPDILIVPISPKTHPPGFAWVVAKSVRIHGRKGIMKRSFALRRQCPGSRRQSLLSGWNTVGPRSSKSKDVLDVLKSREELEISLSWSCLPGLLAAKFQSPQEICLWVSPPVLCNLCTSLEIQACLWACPESHSVQGSTSESPAGIAETQTPNVN